VRVQNGHLNQKIGIRMRLNPLWQQISYPLEQGLQTTALGSNPALKAISSGPRGHFVNNEKRINLQKLIDLAICSTGLRSRSRSRSRSPGAGRFRWSWSCFQNLAGAGAGG